MTNDRVIKILVGLFIIVSLAIHAYELYFVTLFKEFDDDSIEMVAQAQNEKNACLDKLKKAEAALVK